MGCEPSIIEFLDDREDGLGRFFAGETWDGWRSVLKGAFALPMGAAELDFFRKVAQRDPPTKPVKEFWAVCGRRAGKDSIASAIGCHTATMRDFREYLRPGEAATIMVLACDRDQAKTQFNYQDAYFTEVPSLARMLADEPTRDTITLKNGTQIAIHANNYRSVRGRTMPLAILTEVAFYRSETSATPDFETYRALKPGTLTLPGSMLWGISSPWKAAGLLHQKWQRHFGHDDSDDVLVIQAASNVMNPLLPQAEIDAAVEDDPEAAKAEIFAQFRTDITGFLDPDWIERGAVLEHDVPPESGRNYFLAIDGSGGRKDGAGAAVSRRDGKRVSIDAVRHWRAPFSIDTFMNGVAELANRYHCKKIYADRFSKDWIAAAFQKMGLTIEISEKTTSETFLESEALFAQGRIDLPRNRILLNELRNLERHAVQNGRDRVIHPTNLHDDLAAAVCLAARLADAKKGPMVLTDEFMARVRANRDPNMRNGVWVGSGLNRCY